ncbi:MAG: excinuclease ABC subunit A [Desulfobacteraceae bacterium]|nr:MAG: excinuclease ABC subunit A [Desulfobacteraceae bacterium]
MLGQDEPAASFAAQRSGDDMSQSPEFNPSSFKVRPIGRASREPSGTLIHVHSDFTGALKDLDAFSHIHILYSSPKRVEPSGIPGVFTRRHGSRPNSLGLLTTGLKEMVPEQGGFHIRHNGLPDQADILDIKAYFPIEDRLKTATMPPESEIKQEEDTTCPTGRLPGREPGTGLGAIGEVRVTDGRAWASLQPRFSQGLEGLESFSHVRILFWFNRFDKAMYRRSTQCRPPYRDAPKTGIFSTRSPVRPNPIGMTIVKVKGVDPETGILDFSGIDAFDRTPILDILPYVPALDRPGEDEKIRVPQWLRHWPSWYTDHHATVRSADELRPAPIDLIGSPAPVVMASMENNDKWDSIQAAGDCPEEILIQGARQHNLKHIDVRIPKNKLTVITGVSGSGKSTLAFDTLYAEGQRRYMDSLSSGPMARPMAAPLVDRIDGLIPVVAVEQKTVSRNPRSTVGTITDMSDYLRLLFARASTLHCPGCGQGIVPADEQMILGRLLTLSPGTRFSISTPDGEAVKHHTITDPMPPGEQASILRDLEIAYRDGNGSLILEMGDQLITLSKHLYCPDCDRVFFDMTPSLFSFNHPEGMCSRCSGLGVILEVDEARLITDPERSLLDGASPWFGVLRNKKPTANWMKGEMFAMAQDMKIDLETPWQDLPQDFRQAVLHGTGDRIYTWVYQTGAQGRKGEIRRPASGIVNHIKRLFSDSKSSNRDHLLRYMGEQPCPHCQGDRLAPEGRLARLAGMRLPQVNRMSITDAGQWLDGLSGCLPEKQYGPIKDIIRELQVRVGYLAELGLDYLGLDRSAPTLSGGEGQRLRLAGLLGGRLSGLLYILDEPSMGLHPRDHASLLGILKSLRTLGNTVVVVEHDQTFMQAADLLIDMGPGAGQHGGRVVACGTPEQVMADPESVTGKYLALPRASASMNRPVPGQADQWIRINGADRHNLKAVDVSFPLGRMICVTGVSGSGKSSLVTQTLVPAIESTLKQPGVMPGGDFESIQGTEAVDNLVFVTQSPIGRTPRSNPGTYTGVFEPVRKCFASLPEAKKMNLKSRDFSVNTPGGRCEACKGIGQVKIDLHFMPDHWMVCDQCRGRRYQDKVLEITFQGHSIADILEMDIEACADLFRDMPGIMEKLSVLCKVGLGYLKLGQSAVTLSGGEAQRIKLARELSSPGTGRTLFVLDEPTTGLHARDIDKLMQVLGALVDAGNTVIIIEHHLDVIQQADWIIDMGPGGGEAGGRIIAQGPVADIREHPGSITAQYLGK